MKIKTTMLRAGTAGALLLASSAIYGVEVVGNGGTVVGPAAGDLNIITGVDEVVTIGPDTALTTDYSVNDDLAGQDPAIDPEIAVVVDPIAGTTPVYTILGGAEIVESQETANSGVTVDDNGNITLNAGGTDTTTVNYIRAVRTDIYNFVEGDPNSGTTAQEVYVGGYMDGDVFVELGELMTGADWDTLNSTTDYDGTPLDTELILDPAVDLSNFEVLESIAGDGGTLTVGGDASVVGTTTLGDLIVTGDTTLAGVTAGDVAASTVTTTGDATVGGALAVTGDSTLAGVTAGDVAAASLGVSGDADVDGVLAVGDIDNVETTIGANTDAIDALDTRVGTAEGEIDALQTFQTTAEGEIDALQDMQGIHHDLLVDPTTGLVGRVATAEGEIDTLQTDVGDLQGLIYLDENGATHVGPDSLVTQYDAADDEQNLWAMNGDDEIIPINVTTDMNVDGTFTVSSDAAGVSTEVEDILEPNAPYLDSDGVVANTVAVYTEKQEVSEVESNITTAPGFVANRDGNVWLNKGAGTTTTIEYVTAIRQDIWDETQEGNAGLVQGSVEVAGYIDGAGNFVELGELISDGAVDGQGLFDTSSLTEAQLAALELAGYYTPDVDIQDSGGNLYVQGNTDVDGTLSVGAISDVEAAIGANETAIEANTDAIDDNADAIGENADDIEANAEAISDEATARADADEDLQDQIDDNADTLDVHFGLVSGNISDIAANTSAISALESAMDQARMDIDTNTRGIAMVAALTHTTILPGMENALDISMAYFEGETGISISYSRRVNENTQINFAAASTSDFEESVVRAGIGWQW